MKKYFLPIVNLVMISLATLLLNLRDDTPFNAVLIIIGVICVTAYLIKNLKNGENTIKVNALNKALTLGAAILTIGALYEFLTGERISDESGDIMAVLLVIVCIGIWLYDYFIKPFKN